MSQRAGRNTVVNDEGILCGVISDGDLRRLIENSPDPLRLLAGPCMTRAPKTITEDELATAALAKMEGLKITSVVVVDERRRILGLLHIRDLWRTQMF